MRRLSTPTHRFELDLPDEVIGKIDSIMITYAQGGAVVLDKRGNDVTIEGRTAITKLTQEDTKKFTPGTRVEMQIRFLTVAGDSFPSNIMTADCERVLNDEVMA